jgi:galactokinase
VRDFRAAFGTEPAARGTAPGRVNLIGDHTDYNGGLVMPVAIPQHTTVEIAPAADASAEVYSANVDQMLPLDAASGLADFGRYVGGVVKVLAEQGRKVPPLKVHIFSAVPIGAGLSSSAALEIATLRALDSLLDLKLSAISMAQIAWQAETEHAGVECGVMDQIACAIATPDRMLFLNTATLDYELLPLPVESELLVVDSGIPRALAQSAYNQRRAECMEAARRLGVANLSVLIDPNAGRRLPAPLQQRVRHVVSENARVRAARDADAPGFGVLMNESHASLRDDYEVSIPPLDALVALLQAQEDVFGARMTGAGFGGACVALVRAGGSARVAEAIRPGVDGARNVSIVVPP